MMASDEPRSKEIANRLANGDRDGRRYLVACHDVTGHSDLEVDAFAHEIRIPVASRPTFPHVPAPTVEIVEAEDR